MRTTQTNSLHHQAKHDAKEWGNQNFLFTPTIVACLKYKQNPDSKPQKEEPN